MPTIYVDGSVLYDLGDAVKVLLYTRRATEPDVADHVATIVLTRHAADHSVFVATVRSDDDELASEDDTIQ